MIHPSSVNHVKFETSLTEAKSVKQVIAYSEKRRNVSVATQGTPATFLISTTRVDPLIYLLFGAYKVERTSRGLMCDDWVHIIGHLDGLEDLYQLKLLFNGVMKRVYQGLIMKGREQRIKVRAQEGVDEREWEDCDERDFSLSKDEMKELNLLSRDLVDIMEVYTQERIAAPSRAISRPPTPSRLTKTAASTQGTPYASRASTPLGRMRRW
jgi:small subunit ribosomal protein S24e